MFSVRSQGNALLCSGKCRNFRQTWIFSCLPITLATQKELKQVNLQPLLTTTTITTTTTFTPTPTTNTSPTPTPTPTTTTTTPPPSTESLMVQTKFI